MIEVIKPGLETTIQDYPGRIGTLRHGIPPSGPMDDWSFRAANRAVGNPVGAPGLECQFLGPTLRFHGETLFSVCGADMQARLDGRPIAPWSTVRASAGQVLELGAAMDGARTYVAFRGGLSVPQFMGACATYVVAGIGGLDGRALKAGDRLALGTAEARSGHADEAVERPPFQGPHAQLVGVVLGPNDDWIAETGHKLFFSSEWVISSRSNRVGLRLEGPALEYSAVAYDKPSEAGSDPSNTIDIGYPIGGINIAGETPIILMHDCLTLGGFIVPYTVPSCEFWKLGQCRPWTRVRFKPMTREEAQHERERIDSLFA